MDEILSALASPPRLRIVLHLAANGPTRQVDLIDALSSADQPLTAGEMSHLVKTLLGARLVIRDRPRGPLRLAHEEQTKRLLAIASAIAVAAASDSRSEAERRHSELMRALAAPVDSGAQHRDID